MHGPDFQRKLQVYNDYYEDKPKLQIILNEAEPREEAEVYAGNLKVYWGIVQPIRLKLKDDRSSGVDIFNRHSFSHTDSNQESQLDYFMNLSKSSNLEESIDSPVEPPSPGGKLPSLSNQVARSQSSVVMRPNRRRPKKRLSIINGHLFSAETSMFTPVHGTPMSVNVTTLDSTSGVIKTILNKFKVDNSPNEFCLCAVKASGETRIMGDNVIPLVERIMYGPLEDNVKFYLVEKYRVVNINEEVANFVNLPDAVLEAFLLKYSNDEKLELEMIKERYNLYKEKLLELLGDTALLM